MEKHFLVEQPPISAKYRLLVDELSENETFGFTNDIDKIAYNRNILGSDFNQVLSIKLLLPEKGASTVFSIGRFIVVLEIGKDEKDGKMHFFDFNIDTDNLDISTQIKQQFSENIASAWFKNYYLLRSEFLEESDRFELFKPTLS